VAKRLARESKAEYCGQTHCAPPCSALLTHIQPVLTTRDGKSEQLLTGCLSYAIAIQGAVMVRFVLQYGSTSHSINIGKITLTLVE
jgi:hypothetical protein